MTVFAGLAHRLLVDAARAHQEGYETLRWTDLAERAGDDATYRRVDRALRHLADEGLIEGVVTPSGWFEIRVTPRGFAKVRRELNRAHEVGTVVDDHGVVNAGNPALVTKFQALDQQIGERSRVLDQKLVSLSKEKAAKAKGTITPALAKAAQQTRDRLTAARGHLALAWHTLTTFP